MQNSTPHTDIKVFLYQLDITILIKGLLFYFYVLRDKHKCLVLKQDFQMMHFTFKQQSIVLDIHAVHALFCLMKHYVSNTYIFSSTTNLFDQIPE